MGAEIALPPLEIRGSGRTPADTAAVAAWLTEQAGACDGIVASVEYLAWGNLINSRISSETVAQGLARLVPLVQAHENGALVYAFVLITRVANANDCVEEPLWWKTFGTRCYALSQLLHKQTVGALEPGELSDAVSPGYRGRCGIVFKKKFLINVWIVLNNFRKNPPCAKMNFRIFHLLFQAADDRRREDDVADGRKTKDKKLGHDDFK